MDLSLPSRWHTQKEDSLLAAVCFRAARGWPGINPGNLRVLHNSYFLRALMKGTLFAYLPGGFELVFHAVLVENFFYLDFQ